jgi:hypothetical protein
LRQGIFVDLDYIVQKTHPPPDTLFQGLPVNGFFLDKFGKIY